MSADSLDQGKIHTHTHLADKQILRTLVWTVNGQQLAGCVVGGVDPDERQVRVAPARIQFASGDRVVLWKLRGKICAAFGEGHEKNARKSLKHHREIKAYARNKNQFNKKCRIIHYQCRTLLRQYMYYSVSAFYSVSMINKHPMSSRVWGQNVLVRAPKRRSRARRCKSRSGCITCSVLSE